MIFKIVISSILLLFYSNCIAGYIDDTTPAIFVRVSGKTKEEAFREAIRKASGIVINSQLESNDNVLTEDKIFDYSSGFIQSYEIIKETPDNVEITALVSSDKIANRILNRKIEQVSVANQSQQLYAQILTILDRKKSANTLLQNISKDFPSNALVATPGMLGAVIDQGNNSILEIPITIKWSKNYLESLKQTVRYLAVEKCYSCTNNIKFSNGIFDLDKLVGYKLDGEQQFSIIQKSFPSLIGIEVSFFSKEGDKQSTCYGIDLQESARPPLNQLVSYHYDDKSMNFQNDIKKVIIRQPINYKLLPRLSKIEAVMVKQCK